MTISLIQANEYFNNRLHADEWTNATDENKTKAINTAEVVIQNTFILREGFADTTSYLHGVCEQAIHLMKYSKERLQLQQEGVTSYNVEDMSFQMSDNLIAPIVKAFIKPIIKTKVGDIV